MHQSQPQSSPTLPAGAASISQLVQALQSGQISKAELYAQLTSMHKGQAANTTNTNNSFSSNAGSVNSTVTASPYQTQRQTMQQPQPPQQYSYQQQQQSVPSTPFYTQPAYSQPLPPQQQHQQHQPQPAALPASSPYSAQAQAAQAHIQAFLAKHLPPAHGQRDHAGAAPGAYGASNSYGGNDLSARNNTSMDSARNQRTQSSSASHVDTQPRQRFAPSQQHDQSRDDSLSSSFDHSAHGSESANLARTGSLRRPRPVSASASTSAGPGSSARQRSRSRMSEVYSSEAEAENTFRPAVKPLPGMYASNQRVKQATPAATPEPAPFLGRVMHWAENKRARERHLSVESERKSLDACTFKPVINPESQAIVAAPGEGHRRLFSARSTARAKIIELEVRRKEEDTFRAACTFEPSLNRRSLALAQSMAERPAEDERPTGRQPQSQGISSVPQDLVECTFAPKTNSLKKGMLAASVYLEQNAFARLSSAASRPSTARKGKKSSSQEDAGYSSDGASVARGRGHARGGSASSKRSSSQDRNNALNVSSSSQQQDAQFTEFLARLKYNEFQRAERLEFLKQEEAREHQYGRPMLSKASARIVARNALEGKYNSPNKSTESRDQSLIDASPTKPDVQAAVAKRAAAQLDPHCTFAPSINPYSSSLPKRTAADMSARESMRRANNLERLAGAHAAREMEEVSFQPHLHRPPSASGLQSVDGRLRVLSDPAAYVDRLASQQRLRDAEAARQRELRQVEEVKECTFAPTVHESPAFVKRIAKSMEATRKQQALLKAKKGPVKQDWK